MVRTGNIDFSCKRLTSIEVWKSKYHIIRRVRFRWDPPPPLEKDIWICAWKCIKPVCVTEMHQTLLYNGNASSPLL